MSSSNTTSEIDWQAVCILGWDNEWQPTCPPTLPTCNNEWQPTSPPTLPTCNNEWQPTCSTTLPTCNNEWQPTCPPTLPTCNKTKPSAAIQLLKKFRGDDMTPPTGQFIIHISRQRSGHIFKDPSCTIGHLYIRPERCHDVSRTDCQWGKSCPRKTGSSTTWLRKPENSKIVKFSENRSLHNVFTKTCTSSECPTAREYVLLLLKRVAADKTMRTSALAQWY